MKKNRILVVDDHAVVRMGLIALLEAENDIEVVGEAGDGPQAVALALRAGPDAILMDLCLPGCDGAEATAQIKTSAPDTRILILTTFGNAADITRALDAGADGVLLKNSGYDEVVTAIRRITKGEKAVAEDVRKMLKETTPVPELSARQREVLSSMARGLTNADIAKQFGITPDGVKFHISSILAKLGAANRTEAIAIAIRGNLLDQT